MKKYLFLCTTCIVALIIFSGCSKKSDSNPASSDNMTATINGVSYSTTSIGAVGGLVGGINDVTIVASKNGSQFVDIDLWGTIAVGKYPVVIPPISAGGVSICSYNTGSSTATQTDAVYGVVNVTNVSSKGTITGNFTFTTADSTHITGGNFVVTPQ